VLLLIVFAWTVATSRHVHPPTAAMRPAQEYSIPPRAAATLPRASTPAPQDVQPNRLYLPALHVVAEIVPIAASITHTATQRTISVTPPPPAQVGLYTGGAALDAGQGTVLIVGHINLNGVSGAFRNLSATPLASDVWVSDAAGKLTHWRVYANPVVNKHSSYWPVDVFDPAGPRRLVLASCTGALAYVGGYGYSYDDNQFIYATEVAA
jgi:hypothetical protein